MLVDIHVEVAYALPLKQYLLKVTVPQGATVQQAIEASGILELRPEIEITSCKTGIFSRAVPLNSAVAEGDRVEIYRPLIADPKELRRIRAEKSAKKTLS